MADLNIKQWKPSLSPLDAAVTSAMACQVCENGLLAEPNTPLQVSELQFALASSRVPVRAQQNAAV